MRAPMFQTPVSCFWYPPQTNPKPNRMNAHDTAEPLSVECGGAGQTCASSSYTAYRIEGPTRDSTKRSITVDDCPRSPDFRSYIIFIVPQIHVQKNRCPI